METDWFEFAVVDDAGDASEWGDGMVGVQRGSE
jgi:hypothetical protein